MIDRARGYPREYGDWVSRGNYARHVRRCRERRRADTGGSEGDVGAGGGNGSEARVGGRTRGKVAECQLCGRTLSYSNMARHQMSCRVWDPGGGPMP